MGGDTGAEGKGISMGNTQARNRLKAQDFAYIAKNTAFLTNDVVRDYHKEILENSSVGKIEPELFKKIFRLAFPERPEDKLDMLVEKIRNVEKTDGSIPIHSIAMLIYLFCDGRQKIILDRCSTYLTQMAMAPSVSLSCS